MVGIDRDPTRARAGRRAAGAVRRPVHRRARGLRRDRPTCSPTSGWPRWTACSSTSASPRCSSTSASAASPTPRTRRSTCGWTARAGRTAADVLNTYPAADLTRVLREYGEEKFARKIADAVVREREREPFTTSGRLVELLYAEIPAPARRTGGTPGQAHLPGAADGGQRRARRAAPGDPGRDRRDRRRRPRGRRVLPLARGPAGRSRRSPRATRSDVPEDLPFVPEGHEPALRLVTRGAEKADRAEIDREPARRLGAAARRRTSQRRQRSRSMSTPASASCDRVPRSPRDPAREAAVERARLTVVPRPADAGPRGCRS